jgi:hypothetical protein
MDYPGENDWLNHHGKGKLEHHYRLFREALYSDNFTGPKVDNIRSKALVLCKYENGDEYRYAPKRKKLHLFNDAKDTVIYELWYTYLDKGHYKLYDPQYSPATWVVSYIHKNINNLIRKRKPRSLERGIDPRTDILDEQNINFRASYDDYQDWLNLNGGLDNPESILIAKEFLGMALGHFGEVGTQVLVGMVDRQEAAVSYGLSYECYSKQLERQRVDFAAQLKKINWLD